MKAVSVALRSQITRLHFWVAVLVPCRSHFLIAGMQQGENPSSTLTSLVLPLQAVYEFVQADADKIPSFPPLPRRLYLVDPVDNVCFFIVWI